MITHNGRRWEIVERRNSWFARDDLGNDTGPFASPAAAVSWIRAIRAA